jgi:predicted metal-dependent hydrolase
MMQRLVQMTLDLFDTQSAAREAVAPVAPPVLDAPLLVLQGPQLPPVPLEQQLAPARFEHPRANRQAVLQGAIVAYEFKRAKRRTIGFVVGPEGLVVSAPRWVVLAEVDAAVREKGSWIVQKLAQARERHRKVESSRIEWKNGAVLPFLGEPVRLVIDPRHAFHAVGAELKPGAAVLQGAPGDAATRDCGLTLQLGLAHNAEPSQIRDVVQAWLMRQAKRVFTERMHHFAPQVGVQWKKLSLSSAGTRWGSASADGSIRLNWRLIHFRQPVIDYVVVHELSHLRVMDHSPKFWDTVRTVVPDYQALRGQLKDVSIPQWD